MLKLDPTAASGKCNHFDIRLKCLMVAAMTKNCSGVEVNIFVLSINYLDTEYYDIYNISMITIKSLLNLLNL